MPRSKVEVMEDQAIVSAVHHIKPQVDTIFGPDPIIQIHTNKGILTMRVDHRLQFHESDYEGERLVDAISDIQARAKLLDAA